MIIQNPIQSQKLGDLPSASSFPIMCMKVKKWKSGSFHPYSLTFSPLITCITVCLWLRRSDLLDILNMVWSYPLPARYTRRKPQGIILKRIHNHHQLSLVINREYFPLIKHGWWWWRTRRRWLTDNAKWCCLCIIAQVCSSPSNTTSYKECISLWYLLCHVFYEFFTLYTWLDDDHCNGWRTRSTFDICSLSLSSIYIPLSIRGGRVGDVPLQIGLDSYLFAGNNNWLGKSNSLLIHYCKVFQPQRSSSRNRGPAQEQKRYSNHHMHHLQFDIGMPFKRERSTWRIITHTTQRARKRINPCKLMGIAYTATSWRNITFSRSSFLPSL